MSSDNLLGENDRKEKLSVAYVSAVAAAAGYVTSEPNADRDSIDLEVAAGGSMRARVALQLKATASPNWVGDQLKFSVRRKNYDDLIALRQVPLILVVMTMPKEESKWLESDDEVLQMRHCAWWLSLRGFPAVEQESKVIDIPQSQRFDTMSLKALIEMSRKGEL